MKRVRWAQAAGVLAALIACVGCQASPGDKSGGAGATEVLVLANNDGTMDGAPAVQLFADRAGDEPLGRLEGMHLMGHTARPSGAPGRAALRSVHSLMSSTLSAPARGRAACRARFAEGAMRAPPAVTRRSRCVLTRLRRLHRPPPRRSARPGATGGSAAWAAPARTGPPCR